MFMYTPFFQWMKSNGKFDIDIDYYTAEMPIEEIIAEFHAYWILMHSKKLVDMDHIYSLGESRISKEVDDLLNSKECEDITNEFEKKVNIVNESFGYKFLYKELIRSAEKHGNIKWGLDDGESKFVEEYKEKDPNMFNIKIVDNFQRLKCIPGESAKQTIDELSRRMDWGRQKFNQTWVGLQQINRNTKNLDRYKLGQFFPGPESLKDSENPYHDAQVCIVGISPKALTLSTFEDYKILHNRESKGLMDRIRPIKVIKNRGGVAHKTGYLGFLGECAYFWELPDADSFNSDKYNEFNKKFGE